MKENNNLNLQDKKLGRGLSALLGDNKSKGKGPSSQLFYSDNISGSVIIERSEVVIESISLNKITAGVYQPRRIFDQAEIEDLAQSIKENGLIQPILLRKADGEGHYEIIAGERRFRAIKSLGHSKISAIVKKINNHEALELALIENIQRADLSPVEEARGYKQLIDDFSYTQEQVSLKTGKSRAHIANLLRILNLPKNVQDLLEKGLITTGHAKAIANSSDPENLARKIIDLSLTVRDSENLLRIEKVSANAKKSKFNSTKNKQLNNAGEIVDMENRLSQLIDCEAKIYYNQIRNRGKITISFSDIEKVMNIIAVLEG